MKFFFFCFGTLKTIQRKPSSWTSPSFSPYGYWFANLFRILAFCSIEKRKGLDAWIGSGEEGCPAWLSHGMVWLWGFTHISKAKLCSVLLWLPSGPWVGLQPGTAAHGRSSMLKPFPRAALHAQLSLFTCVFLSGSGFVPYIAMSFMLPGAAWFWSKPWT